MDTGCTFPVTTTAVVEGMKAEVIPLKEELDIIDASGKSLAVLRTCKMFIEKKILGGRKIGRSSSNPLQLLKKWDLIHYSFPFVNKSNKKYAAY